MIIIGERINTSRKAIAPAVMERNAQFIIAEANRQIEAGAAYIDVNCGTMVDNEPETLAWLVQTVQTVPGVLCSIDSPNPAAIERALKVHQGQPIINSITGEKERWEGVLPLVKEYHTGIIALAMDDEGMPETTTDRLRIAGGLIDRLVQAGVALSDIYLDPMVRPVSTGDHYGTVVFETIRRINQEFPGVHTACGLSNISFGLPVRKLINQAFLVLALSAGLDTAILDPLDRKLLSLIYAAELLVEKDASALNYITAFREEKLTD